MWRRNIVKLALVVSALGLAACGQGSTPVSTATPTPVSRLALPETPTPRQIHTPSIQATVDAAVSATLTAERTGAPTPASMPPTVSPTIPELRVGQRAYFGHVTVTLLEADWKESLALSDTMNLTAEWLIENPGPNSLLGWQWVLDVWLADHFGHRFEWVAEGATYFEPEALYAGDMLRPKYTYLVPGSPREVVFTVESAANLFDSVNVARYVVEEPAFSTPSPTSTALPISTLTLAPTTEEGLVTNVDDGDTIDVLINGSEYRVR